MSVPIDWLNKINQKFRDAGLEHRRRPYEAMREFSLEFQISVDISSPIYKEIFEWFEERSKPGTHQFSGLFNSVYFIDAAFWSLSMGIVFGNERIEPFDCLKDMPKATKDDLFSSSETAWDYISYWLDWVDYGMGIGEMLNRSNLEPSCKKYLSGIELLNAGDQELRAAISQLNEKRPNSRPILSCRNATEIFLKSYIALKTGLTNEEARKLGRNLEKSFDRFVEVSGYQNLLPLKRQLTVYPAIGGRYEGQAQPLSAVWEGLRFAQFMGTTIIREYTKSSIILD